MELRRTILIIAMAVVSYFLLINWQKEYYATDRVTELTPNEIKQTASDIPSSEKEMEGSHDVPSVSNSFDVAKPALPEAINSKVSVKTDVLNIDIDLNGGDIIYASFPLFTESIDSKKPFVLLNQSAGLDYVAQTGLVGKNGPDASPAGRPRYQSTEKSFILQPGEELLKVTLRLSQDNVEILKTYEFKRGDYLVKVRYEVANRGVSSWSGVLFGQFKRDNSKDPSASKQGFGMSTFLGTAWWTPEKSYNKLALNKFEKEPVKEVVTGGWIAMVQHYFVAAWIPDSKVKNTYSTRVKEETGENIAGFTGPAFTVAPGNVGTQEVSLYIGPKVQEQLKKISDGLELTVDYGMLWFIAQFLFWLLVKIHSFIGNWGWSIVVLTIIVKAAFFQLSATSYKSMAHMRRVTPEIQRIRELYANDRAKMSQAMMDLYRKEKINPLGGCLPILVQMPVFISLYWTLMESVELRHAEWIFWIRDLSAMDPYFILPLIMGASMFIQMALNPPPPDPMQARVMKIMPIVFTIMFLWFPAGLVLYWVVNNILSIAQQAVITRQIEKIEGKHA